MMKTFLVAFILCLSPAFTRAADRIALVIGVDTYDHLAAEAQLEVAVADAKLVAATLASLQPRFDVTLLTETSLEASRAALNEFVKKAKNADCALVYFAGHGVEYHGENFLLVKDTEVSEISDEVDRMKRRLREKALSLQTVVDELDATRAAVKVVIVDACRNNPLRADTPSGARALVGSRGGLAQVTPPSGTLISYSADAGQQANDGLFTRLLVEQIKKPGQSIMETFAATRERVLRESAALAEKEQGVRHEPAEYVKLNVAGMRFSFLPGAAPAIPQPLPPPHPEKHPLLSATKDSPWVNELGMEFIPLPGKPGVFMCRTETRVRDFRAYARAAGFQQSGGAYVLKVTENGASWELDHKAGWENPGFAQSEDHPVCCVSWEEARAFCAWLSTKDSRLTYRLPSDEEWSAAVGSLGKYPWGNAWPAPKGSGNYFGTEGPKKWPGSGWSTAYDYDDGFATTAPVGSFSPNRFGFFELGGNLFEWCEDHYRSAMNDPDALEKYSVIKKEVHDDGTPYRVLRGGSWLDYVEFNLRSSSRISVLPTYRVVYGGFRCVVLPAR